MSRTYDRVTQEPVEPDRMPSRSLTYMLAGGLFFAFLALYVRTAAPSVLSGDSAEFQLAAPLLGVPHPTTYPLYVLLGKLATLLVPLGDLAWRVTLVSALSAALAVGLFFLLARRVVGSLPAAMVGALAFGFTPGLWNAATIAEVYALLAALLAGFAYAIAVGCRPTGPAEPKRERIDWRGLRLAAFLGGLGVSHHGLFAIAGLPLLAGYLLWLIVRTAAPSQAPRLAGRPLIARDTAKQMALLALCFAAGLLPWLYPLVQYARYGPFTGLDYGLPRHYFWGAPQSPAQVLSLLTGGPLRQGVFRAPSLGAIAAVLSMVGSRLLFEFGPLGVPLGLLGCLASLRRARIVWAGAAWVFLSTLAYLLLLGPAVQDAPVFTLPMLLPWALWIAAGVEFILQQIRNQEPRTKNQEQKTTEGERRTTDDGRRTAVEARRSFVLRPSSFVIGLLIVAMLAWGYTRLPFSSKRQLWLFRRFGEATLAQLPRDAVVIAHWEQGMALQYLILAERRRPDVWVDVVEPGDVAWSARARRYAGRAVFFAGTPADVAGLPVELAREDDYADLFMLRR